MRRSTPLRALAATLAAAAACAIGAPGAAQAASRLECQELPSKGNVDVKTTWINRLTGLNLCVQLPEGYDENPTKEYPVLWLLQGIGDHAKAWSNPGTGNLAELSKGFPGIVVMPESGRGFLMDWWRGGARNGPNWTRYTLEEVLPFVEDEYRILPGRANHAIGGPSMGGYGALLLGGLQPSYFGSVISQSGLVDSQSLETYLFMPNSIRTQKYESVWGPINGSYATANNPIKTPENLAHSRVYLSTGDGRPDPKEKFLLPAWTNGVVIELVSQRDTRKYAQALTKVGAPHVVEFHGGVHDWPYWRRDLPKALAWDPFATPPTPTAAEQTDWTYKTMAPRGNAWGLGYRFSELPRKMLTLTRKGQLLTATGSGEVTIAPGAADADATGAGTKPACSFTAKLPFERTLPAGC